MNWRVWWVAIGVLTSSSAWAVGDAVPVAKQSRKNVLLICIDDLRPVMGCYGGQAITPNIDRFAKTAIRFDRHYVQWPVCGPSRCVLTGGVRPDRSGIYHNGQWSVIAQQPDRMPTLPLSFRRHGYTTLGFGKIYHGTGGADGCGWSEKPTKSPTDWACYVDFPYQPKAKNKRESWRPAIEIFNGNEQAHTDFRNAEKALAAIQEHQDVPFFIAVGFYKPHLPLVAPKRSWELYDDVDLAPLAPQQFPADAVDFMYNWGEIDSYGYSRVDENDVEQRKMFSRSDRPDESQTLQLTKAYYACVSYTDHHIGRLLEQLERLGLTDSTAVVIWGDHGFHLGDQNRWAKHTQFEGAMRSPLIVRFPGRQSLSGRHTDAIVETVDVYPTLVEYCGLDRPEHLQGESLMPLVSGDVDAIKHAAFGQISPVGGDHQNTMAYTVRTKRYRYVQWRDQSQRQRVLRHELYDYTDGLQETRNVVGQSQYKSVVSEHAKLITDHFESLR
tara:strand:- start:270140 stop:271633 length:1494 start_codon:yes stop_codon:yes gene_type:complete